MVLYDTVKTSRLIDHLNVMNLDDIRRKNFKTVFFFCDSGDEPYHSFSFFKNLSLKLQNKNPPQRLTLPCHRAWHHWFSISLTLCALVAIHEKRSYICPVVPYALSPLMNHPIRCQVLLWDKCCWDFKQWLRLPWMELSYIGKVLISIPTNLILSDCSLHINTKYEVSW